MIPRSTEQLIVTMLFGTGCVVILTATFAMAAAKLTGC